MRKIILRLLGGFTREDLDEWGKDNYVRGHDDGLQMGVNNTICEWSGHAIKRAIESPLNKRFALQLERFGEKYHLSEKQEIQKFQKYGMDSIDNIYKKVTLDIIYTKSKDGKVITFTVKNHKDGAIFGKDVFIVKRSDLLNEVTSELQTIVNKLNKFSE